MNIENAVMGKSSNNIGQAVVDLNSQLANLSSVLTGLYEELSPILIPEFPEAINKGTDINAVGNDSTIYSNLVEMSETVSRFVVRAEDIRSRVQL